MLDADDHALLDIWQEWRGRPTLVATLGGVTEIPGPRVMPFAGGLLDQPACVLDALKIMDAAAAAIPAGHGGEE